MPQMLRHAEFSGDHVYRYKLSRVWGDKSRVTFIMLNPSSADEHVDDRTIGRCVSFAQQWGFGGLNVVNLYAFRATNPQELWRAEDPVGPDNDRYLREAATGSVLLVAAWSALAEPTRVEEVLEIPGFDRLMCLTRNRDSSPRHPLYAKATSEPSPWSV